MRTIVSHTFWLSACVLALTSQPLPAAEYFVDQNHPQTSDENPGTSDKPFRTINRSFRGLKPGDTVWVKEGVYRENIMLASEPGSVYQWKYAVIPSGMSYAEMLSFHAWPGDEVVIKGSDLVTGWAKGEGDTWVKHDWKVNSQQVFVDGKALQQIGGEMVDYLTMRGRWRGRQEAGRSRQVHDRGASPEAAQAAPNLRQGA